MKLKTLSLTLLLSLGLAGCGESKELSKTPEVKEEIAKKLDNKSNEKNFVEINLPVEGEDYKVLEIPFEIKGIPDNSLVEVFWLGCPHCQKFEVGLRAEKENLDKNMPFFKIHAVSGNPQWLRDAYVYNMMVKATNNNEKVMNELFDFYTQKMEAYKADYKLNKEKTKLTPYPKINELSKFAEENIGMSNEEFEKMFNSEEIKNIVKSHGEAFNKSKLQGVPAFIVNKKYLITGKGVNSYKEYFEVVNKVFNMTKK